MIEDTFSEKNAVYLQKFLVFIAYVLLFMIK
jgi:hypothetical protein